MKKVKQILEIIKSRKELFYPNVEGWTTVITIWEDSDFQIEHSHNAKNKIMFLWRSGKLYLIGNNKMEEIL